MASKPRKPARKGRKSAPKKRTALARPSRSFVKKVNSVIHKNAETKQKSYTLGTTSFNSGVNAAGDILRVLPTIDQGTGEANRIGDTVTAQNIDVRGHFFINVTPNVVGSSGNPTAIPANARLMIRAFICSVKKYSNYDDAVSNVGTWGPNFLKNGNASQALDGSIESMYLPVNTDVITVHKEMKKYITIPAINTNVSTSIGFSNTANDYSNSVKFFNANIKCKKVLKYDDTSFSPQNYAPFMVISYAHLDGSNPDVLTTVISATYVSTLKFEDV
jgi:hypothetical protein